MDIIATIALAIYSLVYKIVRTLIADLSFIDDALFLKGTLPSKLSFVLDNEPSDCDCAVLDG